MHALQLTEKLPGCGWHTPTSLRRHRSRSRQERHRCVRQRAPRLRIHALHRRSQYSKYLASGSTGMPAGQRIEHRGPETIEPVVGVGFLRPFVEQLGEVAHITEASWLSNANGDRRVSA